MDAQLATPPSTSPVKEDSRVDHGAGDQEEEIVSAWATLTHAVPDPVFGLIHFFLKDENPKKVLLGVGAYRDDNGKPVILKSVKKAEKILLDKAVEKEYAFPDGIPSYKKHALGLGYGYDHKVIKEDRVASMQTVSGTGGLRMGFAMLKFYFPNCGKKAYVPDPTWSLHYNIIERAGFELVHFRYYDRQKKCVDFSGMMEDLEKMEDESILLLQTSCQNPSGQDLSKDQWYDVLKICKKKKHFVFFDSAYQGFGGVDDDAFDEDNWSVRMFADNYIRVMFTQSFSKNFGLYGERTGCLSIVCTNPLEKEIVQTRMKECCLPEYSNPPIHGAKVVDIILSDEELTKEWKSEVLGMSRRLASLRQDLVAKMKEHGSTHDWQHILNQKGMFAYTGIRPEMVEVLRSEWSIYMPPDGRISVAGVNTSNIDYLAKAFHSVSDGKEI